MTPEQNLFLIVKRGLYYRPEDKGYTGVKDFAARYTLDEVATRFPNLDSPNQDGLEFIAEADAPAYSKACWPETIAAHAIKNRDALIAQQEDEIEQLREALKVYAAQQAREDAVWNEAIEAASSEIYLHSVSCSRLIDQLKR